MLRVILIIEIGIAVLNDKLLFFKFTFILYFILNEIWCSCSCHLNFAAIAFIFYCIFLNLMLLALFFIYQKILIKKIVIIKCCFKLPNIFFPIDCFFINFSFILFSVSFVTVKNYDLQVPGTNDNLYIL
jgi:hypothetical protein